jgi:hypothetical protein
MQRSFGKQALGENYRDLVNGEVFKATLEIGIPLGFFLWFVFQVLLGSAPPLGMWRLAVFAGGRWRFMAPHHNQSVGEAANNGPAARMHEIHRTLQTEGYEPVEISDKHCKMDIEFGPHELAVGPVSIRHDTTYIMLVLDREGITIAGPCGAIPRFVDPPTIS